MKAVGVLWSDREVFIANLKELKEIGNRPDDLQTKVDEISGEMDSVSDEFDEDLWYGMVDTMTVHKDGSAAVRFKGGAEINVK